MSGDHHPPTGGYRTPSGEYRNASGGYRTPSGEYRNASGGHRTPSGAYRNASGGHRSTSGSHRVNHKGGRSRWRLSLILAGVIAGVAVCAVSAVVVLVLRDGSSGPSGRISAQKATAQGVGGERAAVPDACAMVTDEQVEKLVPNFERNQLNSASNTDTHSQCAWTLFSTDSGHQLTVELRAIAGSGGQSATSVAKQTFDTEQASDDAGKGGLSTTQRIISHKPLRDLGDAAYVVYSVDDATGFGSQGFGDAGVNARVVNVLLTVHYGGSQNGGPMHMEQAIAGATETAKNLIHVLAAAS